MSNIDSIISDVKNAKAEKMFDDGVAQYGSVAARLRSLDCKSRDEAIQMLKLAVSVKIYKRDGKVVVE